MSIWIWPPVWQRVTSFLAVTEEGKQYENIKIVEIIFPVLASKALAQYNEVG